MSKFYLLVATILFTGSSFAQNCSGITLESIANTGPFNVATMTEADGLRNGPDYSGATLYYPTNGTPPYSSIVISPGYFSTQASVEDWGPYYASHGIIAMTIGTNSLFENPDSRALGILDALETLRQENARTISPLVSQINIDKFAVGGWSMGGGGAQRAAAMDGTIKAVVAMTPWLSTSSLQPSDLDHAVPVLIFSGQFDPTAPPESHANVHYEYTPSTTDKLKFEVANGDHHIANGPQGAQWDVGKRAIAWLRYFVEEDPCYCPLFLEVPSSASNYTTNVTCGKVISSTGDLFDQSVNILNVYPNPTHSALSIKIDLTSPVPFELVSILGQQMLSGMIHSNNVTLDLSSLSPDIYFLRIGNATYKVLKTK